MIEHKSSSPSLPPGRQAAGILRWEDRYEVIEKIGEGGIGTVY